MSTDESPDAMVSYLMARVESLKLDCRAAHSEVDRLKGELGETSGSALGPSGATPTRTSVSTPEPVAKTPDATEESKEAAEEDEDDFLSEEALANVLAAARDVSAALLLPAGSRPDLDVNGRDLLQSVRQGLCNRLRRLVGEEPLALENRSLSSQKTFGFTLLHIAAAEGQLKACETLLDLGADPNATDLMGRTALHIAANKLHKDVVVLLMSRMSGDVTGKSAPQDAGGITPAGYAAMGERSKAERKELLHLLHRPGDACISPWQSRSASRLKGRSTRKSKLGSSRKSLHTPMVFRKLNETKSSSLPIQFGSSSIPGYRVSMEDAVLLSDSVGPSGQIALFIVFDGHGGKRAPDYLVSNFTSVFEATNEVSSGAAALDRDAMTSALKNACITIDANMSQEAAFVMRETVIQEAMGDDPAVLGKTASEKSGSTAIILAVTRDFAAIGNIGDSRAIVLENNKLTFATRDQRKPRQLENSHPSEKEIAEFTEAAQFFDEELKRIEAAGGAADPVYGRVQFNPKSEASVAMTRCLGDFDFKQNTGNPLTEVLIPVPEVYIIERKPNCDVTVLLASDGIWDIMSNTMCEKALLNALPQDLNKAEMGHNSDLDMVSHTIASSCIDSFDNLSVVIVKMPPKSTIDASAPPAAPSDEGDTVQKNLLSVLEQEAGSIQPPAENSRKDEVSLAMGMI